MRLLVLLLIVMPVVEIVLLIELGSVIGALRTVLLIFVTAVIGAFLLRAQGISTLFRVQQRMADGQVPALEILEGVCLAVGGALLLTPGFVTDAVGFALLVPACRRAIARRILARGFDAVMVSGRPAGPGAPPHGGGVTIDGDYQRRD